MTLVTSSRAWDAETKPGDNSIVVPSPPSIDKSSGAGWLTGLPALGGLGAIGMLAVAPRSPFIYAAGGLFLVMTIAMVVGSVARARRERGDSRSEVRGSYLRELDAVRAALGKTAETLRRSNSRAAVLDEALWVPVAQRDVAVPELMLDVPDDADPFCRDRAQALVDRQRTITGVPVRVRLGRRTRVYGPSDTIRAIQRHIAYSVLSSMAPDDVRIVVLTDQPDRWRALRWAAHHQHPTRADDCGPLRMVAANNDELGDLIRDLAQFTLLFIDCAEPPVTPPATWTVCSTTDSAQADLIADGETLHGPLIDAALPPGGSGESVPLLTCGIASLESAARAAAPAVDELADGVDAAEDSRTLMRPVIGSAAGRHLVLDLREPGEGGCGPHGMLIGATGSGKSELLRLLICRLIANHDSAVLNFAFVDFKGGATFAPFGAVPHVAASITNLEDDPALVNRVREALSAELRRRQRRLQQLGVASIAELPPGQLPRLLIVVDEFSELIVQEPEMIDVLGQIGRLGRSLGVHLLIASQRLDEGRLKGLDSHLSYRIALRTQTAVESRAVIGVPDAANLPIAPGHGYLSAGGEITRFMAGYSGAPSRADAEPDAGPRVVEMRYLNGSNDSTMQVESRPTILHEAIAVASASTTRAQPIWVDPPAASPEMPDLYDDLAVREGRGYGSVSGAGSTVRLGWVDRPDLQSIERYEVDLSAGRGHVGIVGGTRTGVTTAVRTLLVSVALRSTPAEASLFVIALSGNALGQLGQLPHMAAIAGAGVPERVAAIVRHVAGVVAARESAGHADGPEIYLVVDGMARFRADYEPLEPLLLDIARRGLRVGVHLVCTANRWMDFRAQVRDLLGTKLELRLGDPIESEIDRKAAERVPRGCPGRGLTAEGRVLYVAHDRPVGRHSRDVVAEIAAAWTGPRARGLRELPSVVTVANLAPELLDQGLCIAVDRSAAVAASLDEACRFALVLGDPASGRTSVLRSLAAQEAARGGRLIMVDPRRTMLGQLPDESLIGYAPTPVAANEVIAGLADGLERRLPPSDLTPDQVRARSWWSGPQLHLVIDDYDLFVLGGGTLGALRRFLPYAADIGLRVTIARRAVGAQRALHDEGISVMRELGCAVLLLSSSADDGAIHGMRPARLPWSRGSLALPGREPLDVQAVVQPPGA